MVKKQKIILTVILLSIAFAGDCFAWEDCSWHEVGYNKTHFPNQGDWCPNGKFIIQLDFDGGGYGSQDMGNYPIVKSVKCCRPASMATGSASSGERSVASLPPSEARRLQEQIDVLRDEIAEVRIMATKP
jgi:hypothetical protein